MRPNARLISCRTTIASSAFSHSTKTDSPGCRDNMKHATGKLERSVDVTCRIFVISDSEVLFVNHNLTNIQY